MMPRTGTILILAAFLMAVPVSRPDVDFRAGMVPVPIPGQAPVIAGRTEVTVADWRSCHADGGCTHLPVPAAAAGDLPVTGVNWFDVQEYLAWANGKSGGGLRLPHIEEWRHIARSFAHEKPALRFTDPRMAWAASYGLERARQGPPRRAGSFSTTPDGVSDLDGNVWEWTASCASAGFTASDAGRCPAYVAAGEHEAVVSVFIRDPAAGGCATGTPPTHLGFRLVADEPPALASTLRLEPVEHLVKTAEGIEMRRGDAELRFVEMEIGKAADEGVRR